jgi:hypothetical protein
MSDQLTLFEITPGPHDPTKPETRCSICGSRFLFDKHGVPRHPRGAGRRSAAIVHERFQTGGAA